MLIFPFVLELESFKIIGKIFLSKYFLKLQKEWKNQHGVENKSCPKFDFTSPKALKIFFSGQIFLILKFEIFELKYFQKGSAKNFNFSDIALL